MDQRAVAQAAELLVAVRRTGKLIDALPAACKPQTLDDAVAIQDATLAALRETVAGWKVALVDWRVVGAPMMSPPRCRRAPRSRSSIRAFATTRPCRRRNATPTSSPTAASCAAHPRRAGA